VKQVLLSVKIELK